MDVNTATEHIRGRRWRVFFVLLGFVGLIWAVVLLFPGLVGVYYRFRFPESKYPGLYIGITPRGLDEAQRIATGTQYTYWGMSFVVPWSRPITTIDRTEDLGIIQLDFPGAEVVTLGDSRSGDPPSLLETYLSGQPQSTLENEKIMFGYEAFSSNYSFYDAILQANLNDVSVLSDTEVATRELLLSTLKLTLTGMASLATSDHIFSFRTPRVEGIQWGDPDLNKNGSYFDVFDLTGENHHWFSIRGSQDEIDAILSSLELTSSTRG